MLFRLSRSFVQLLGSEVVPALFTEASEDKAITVGKSWHPSLLRLKSNEDLHKLWYVLLREKNIILSDKQLAKQHRMGFDAKYKIIKVKQSMARLLTIVREREIEKEKYWNSLLEEYLKGYESKETRPEKIEKREKLVREETEEWIARKAKRKNAITKIKGWNRFNAKERRSAIQAEYAKQARLAKEEFLKELKFVGLKLREKGIYPKPLSEIKQVV